MKKWGSILQVSFTYVGTVVGAGFATGQEILQFFTRYGGMATLTIGLATALFVWLGIKLMLISSDLGAKSYEDLNNLLFGRRIGNWVSLFTLVTLFGVCTVMLAGAGSVFKEQLHLPYQAGLVITLLLAFLLLTKGMEAIMAANSIVVPLMAFFSVLIVWDTWNAPGSFNWIELDAGSSPQRVWFAPLLYAAFNLTMAQGVLVPLGAQIKDRFVLRWGGILGGVWIGCMLMAGHFALAAQMPDIARFEIPMAQIVHRLGPVLQMAFILVIYGEIFTTLLSDVYGLALQLEQRTRLKYKLIVPLILIVAYAVSQIGFKTLLASLYPLFGMLSMAWMVMMIWHRRGPERPT
ncbi:hypothetical protein PAESOLCIP111_02641 [Paenibacillus solanacearum]|uniref:Membrane protein YkvI n=1 Tax=Paenibacillus solanacearum TaxID=2048548 RepID=A0A916NQG9_9BACL|nr:hypothetical protein [Paenibacillus solanacearum]CAG7624608.1 hypothetical protein PAESOLCIP111_02641 [Paenibacillus solanacearum]